MNGWAYGLEEDDDAFRAAETREEAVEKGRAHAKDFEQNYFYIARQELPHLPSIASHGFDIVGTLHALNEQAPDTGDEWIPEDFPKEQLDELDDTVAEAIAAWLAKYYPPTWFDLGDTERVEC